MSAGESAREGVTERGEDGRKRRRRSDGETAGGKRGKSGIN